MSTTLTLDAFAAVKEKQQATWAAGDYAVIGTSLQIIGERLCEAVDVSAGWKVLDVAAGNGNAALAAARRGCEVTATDYVEALLDRARRRADADGLPLATKVADAEDLPFEEGSFDAVLSTVGVMFTPDPERAAGELRRVVRRRVCRRRCNGALTPASRRSSVPSAISRSPGGRSPSGSGPPGTISRPSGCSTARS
jgi:SAM-dependent methyltransferase